ncbi:MAG TPA: hypothetical protein VG838_15520 [Opitutaceae bacterium]|nr:hypothetical protein [Opitutaceae bacterium]
MNVSRSSALIISAMAGGLLLTTACRDRSRPPVEPQSVAQLPAPSSVNRAEPAPLPPPIPPPPVVTPNRASATAPANAPLLPLSATMDQGIDYPYERRGDYIANINRMTGSADAQIQQLGARRASLAQTSIQDWDVAMTELNSARADLQFKITQLGTATPETWGQAKEGVANAWKRLADAYDKVRLSTTQ